MIRPMTKEERMAAQKRRAMNSRIIKKQNQTGASKQEAIQMIKKEDSI